MKFAMFCVSKALLTTVIIVLVIIILYAVQRFRLLISHQYSSTFSPPRMGNPGMFYKHLDTTALSGWDAHVVE